MRREGEIEQKQKNKEKKEQRKKSFRLPRLPHQQGRGNSTQTANRLTIGHTLICPLGAVTPPAASSCTPVR